MCQCVVEGRSVELMDRLEGGRRGIVGVGDDYCGQGKVMGGESRDWGNTAR